MISCRAIVFDLDGTLVDSYGPIADALNATRAAFGLAPVPLSQVRREVGHGIEALVARHVGDAHVQDGVRVFRSTYERLFVSGTRPLDGVPAVVVELAQRGFRLAVASNKLARFGRPIVDAVGLGTAVTVVLGPEDGVPPKPDPAMLRLAMARLGTGPKETLYVGDMALDAETGRNAEVTPVLVATGSGTRAELEATGAIVLHGLAGLAGLLQLSPQDPGRSD